MLAWKVVQGWDNFALECYTQIRHAHVQCRALRVCSAALEERPAVRRVGLVSKELSRKEASAPAAKKPSKPLLGQSAPARTGMVSKLTVTLPDAKTKKEQVVVATLTLRQVATRLRVPVNDVKDMLRQGVLRGGLSGVPVPELENYIRIHRPHLLRVAESSTVEETHFPTFLKLRRGLMWRLDLWSKAVMVLLLPRKKPVLTVTLPPAPAPEPEGPPDQAAILQALQATDVKRLKAMLEEHVELVLQTTDAEQNTSLHLAVMAGGYERTYLLVNAGAELNARNASGATPLGLVLQGRRGGWRQVATLLQERGGVE